MADLWKDFWTRETGTGQQVAQLHDRYMMMIHIYDISSLRVNQLLYLASLKIYNKFANYFCELKFSGNTH